MGHYDCNYCAESMGDRCCSASKIEGEFGDIATKVYRQARDEAQEHYKDLIAKKEYELYSKYKSKLLHELYTRILKGKIRIKSQLLSNGKYRIYGLVDGWEAYLFEL